MAKQLGSSSQYQTKELVRINSNALIAKLSDIGIPNHSIHWFLKTNDTSHLFSSCQEPEKKRLLEEILKDIPPPLRSMTGDQPQVTISACLQDALESLLRTNGDSSSQDEMNKVLLYFRDSLSITFSDIKVPYSVYDLFLKKRDFSLLSRYCQEPANAIQLLASQKKIESTLRSWMTGDQEQVDISNLVQNVLEARRAQDAKPTRVQNVHEASRAQDAKPTRVQNVHEASRAQDAKPTRVQNLLEASRVQDAKPTRVQNVHEASRAQDAKPTRMQNVHEASQAQDAKPTRVQNLHEARGKPNDLIMECREQLRLRYMDCSNILKIALHPSKQDKIHSVADLHVPAVLKKSEISADLPQMAKIQATDFFKKPHFTKKRILLSGPHGVGKTTEIKMWLHIWCRKISGPLMDFPLVFYIDGAKLEQGASLGKAVSNQCLPGKSAFKPEDIESMCQESQDEILVILDNYHKWSQMDRLNSSLEATVLMHNFPHLTLLVATTSGGVGHFREVYGNYDHVQVEGISEGSVSTYIYKVFAKRKEFGTKVERYLCDSKQVGNMAASPVLLSIMCQIMKWYDNPSLLGDLKTVSALMDKFIDCIIMRHAGDGAFNITQERSNADRQDPTAEEPLRSGAQVRSGRSTTLRSQSGFQDTSLSKDETINHLSAVAFSCYLRGDRQEEQHLSEGDFREVCGEFATEVIEEGCRLGLLKKSSVDEFIPSSQKAMEGKVIGFLSPPFQQRLAAKHFAKLLKGNPEENRMFRNSLQKIGSIENALSLENLLLFACGESRETARSIIGHVADLTSAYARDMYRNPRQDDRVLGQAHVQYHKMIELILNLNYEARSDGRLNDILGPLFTQLRVLTPSGIVTRSLAYLLEHAATPNTPKLDEVDIEAFDVPREMQANLPQPTNIFYKFEGRASVSIERSDSEDASAGGAANLPPLSLTSTDQRRLSNKVNPERTEGKIEEIDRLQYSIDESKLISFGGYGRVYEGKWKGKTVAVKRVHTFEESMTKSLVTEIRINALVNHPNIVVFHAFSKFQPGRTSNLCYDLIMDFIDGFTLNDAVFHHKLKYLQTDRGKLTTAKKVSDAIAHIHAKGYTHSDIKSDNILIRLSDNEPFVCDLGLGHGVTSSKITSTGRRGVIPNWSPPESFDPEYVATRKGDVWSLACVLLELFTGHRLWEDERGRELAFNEILTRFHAGNVTPDIISRVEIAAVRDALQRCFTKDKQKRPSAENLTEIFDGAFSSVNE